MFIFLVDKEVGGQWFVLFYTIINDIAIFTSDIWPMLCYFCNPPHLFLETSSLSLSTSFSIPSFSHYPSFSVPQHWHLLFIITIGNTLWPLVDNSLWTFQYFKQWILLVPFLPVDISNPMPDLLIDCNQNRNQDDLHY